MGNRGYSLLEMMVASAVLTTVSLLGFIAVQSSASSAQLSNAKVDVQNNLRDTMAAITVELREGVTATTAQATGAPPDLHGVVVSENGRELTFQTPIPAEGERMFRYSTPITFRLENEDANGNGRLDPGEDADGDGALTRRIVRVQDGETRSLAGATTIDNVGFQLVENQAAGNSTATTVRIRLEGSKRYGPGEGKLVRASLDSSIRLVN